MAAPATRFCNDLATEVRNPSLQNGDEMTCWVLVNLFYQVWFIGSGTLWDDEEIGNTCSWHRCKNRASSVVGSPTCYCWTKEALALNNALYFTINTFKTTKVTEAVSRNLQWNLSGKVMKVSLKVTKFGPFPCTILYKSCLFYPSWQATSFERPPSWVVFTEGFHCISNDLCCHWQNTIAVVLFTCTTKQNCLLEVQLGIGQ